MKQVSRFNMEERLGWYKVHRESPVSRPDLFRPYRNWPPSVVSYREYP